MSKRRLHPDNEFHPNADPHRRANPYSEDSTEGREALESSAIQTAPPVSEEIHMPDPTLIPILNSVAVTLMLLGVTFSKVLLVAGAILFVITTVRWVRDTRHEIASLPAEHGHH
jgi:hypothetical protein